MPWLSFENTFEVYCSEDLFILAVDTDYLRWLDSSVPSGWHDMD